jgi:hypothetical protein
MSLSLTNDESTATTTTSKNTDCPTYADGTQIHWDNNLATLPGVLHDVAQCWIRRQDFQMLISNNAVVLPNGKLAVDSYDAVQFILNDALDPRGARPDGGINMCPPTPQRLSQTNARRKKDNQIATATTAPAGFSDSFALAGHAVKEHAGRMLTSLSKVIVSAPGADEMIEDAAGHGPSLWVALDALAKEASARDLALVDATFTRVVSDGIKSELSRKVLADHVKLYKQVRMNKPPPKPSDAAEAAMISTIALKDPSVREIYEIKA